MNNGYELFNNSVAEAKRNGEKYWNYSERFMRAGIAILTGKVNLGEGDIDREAVAPILEKMIKGPMHADWYNDLYLDQKNLDGNGVLIPRWRTTSDDTWVKKQLQGPERGNVGINLHINILEYDTAKYPNYDELPKDGQAKNDEAAKFAVDDILKYIEQIREYPEALNREALLSLGNAVHEAWIARERVAGRKVPDNMNRIFKDLSQYMQNKDLLHPMLAIEAVVTYFGPKVQSE